MGGQLGRSCAGCDVCGAAQVVSTSGDTHLGGEDFDHRVMDYFVKLIKKKYQVDVSGDKRALQKLRREAERAKRVLSSSPQVGPPQQQRRAHCPCPAAPPGRTSARAAVQQPDAATQQAGQAG